MNRPEQQIQQACVFYLGILRRIGKLSYFHCPNGGYRSAIEGRVFKSLGVIPGIPDLIILLPKGRIIFIEVKSEKGRISENQKMFHVELERLGHAVYIIRGVDDLKEILTGYGVTT